MPSRLHRAHGAGLASRQIGSRTCLGHSNIYPPVQRPTQFLTREMKGPVHPRISDPVGDPQCDPKRKDRPTKGFGAVGRRNARPQIGSLECTGTHWVAAMHRGALGRRNAPERIGSVECSEANGVAGLPRVAQRDKRRRKGHKLWCSAQKEARSDCGPGLAGS